MNTKELQNLDKKYIWHPFTQMKDWLEEDHPVIVKAQGNYLIDSENNSYFDGVSSLWTIVHGHNHPHINKAIKTQVDKLDHSTLLGLSNEPSILLAEKLVKTLPEDISKIFYSDNGSTANEIAIKMAYQYWQQHSDNSFHTKTKILSFKNAYHGDTIGAVSVGGMDLFHEIFKSLLFDSFKAAYPDCIRCTYRKNCSLQCFNDLESLLSNHHHEIAALVIEPLMQGAAGMLQSPVEFLQKTRQLCSDYNVLMIVDEVATGFGRTGTMFACEKAGISPDLMCLAKGLTGGILPVAVTATTQSVYDGFLANFDQYKTFYHGHTFTGNPIGCAAAIANLEIFETENTLQNLAPKINLLTNELKKIASLAHVGDIRQEGLMVGIELFLDVKTLTPYEAKDKIGHRVILEARKLGVMLRPLGNVIVLMPPLSITNDEIIKIVDVTYKAIESVTG